MFDNEHVPREALRYFSKLHRNLVTEPFETFRKYLCRVFIWEYNCEVDITRSSQIVAMRLHSSEHIAVIVVG